MSSVSGQKYIRSVPLKIRRSTRRLSAIRRHSAATRRSVIPPAASTGDTVDQDRPYSKRFRQTTEYCSTTTVSLTDVLRSWFSKLARPASRCRRRRIMFCWCFLTSPSHSTTGGRIGTRIVALRSLMEKNCDGYKFGKLWSSNPWDLEVRGWWLQGG